MATFGSLSAKMATKFENVMNEDVRALKDVERRFRKPEHTKEHIKEDSDRYIVEKFWTWAKFKL